MPFRVQWAGTCQRWTVALATCLPPRLRTRLRRLLAGKKPGEVVAVKVRRGDQDLELQVTLGAEPR